MNRLKVAACMVAAAVALAGCFSVDVASSPVLGEDVSKHVTVENYGWYLFGRLPLACGNEKLDSWCAFSLFCDEVRPEIAYGKLVDIAKKERCEIQDFLLINDNDVLFEVFDINIPWVIVTKEVSLSANLVKKGGVE